jgi:hypothetical protein
MSLLPKTATATIASGASLSGAVCLGSGVLCAIQMPAGWDAADLTFQVSDDRGSTWKEYDDDTGTAVSVISPAAGKRLELSGFKSVVFLKVRSGTSSVAVNQTADRTLTLITRKFYPEN